MILKKKTNDMSRHPKASLASPAQPDSASVQPKKKPDQKQSPSFKDALLSGAPSHPKIGAPAVPLGKSPSPSQQPAPEPVLAPPIKGVAAPVLEGYLAKPPPPPARKGDGAKKRANVPKPPPAVARMLAPTVKPEPVRPRVAGDLSDDEFGAEIEAENPDLLAKLRKIDAEQAVAAAQAEAAAAAPEDAADTGMEGADDKVTHPTPSELNVLCRRTFKEDQRFQASGGDRADAHNSQLLLVQLDFSSLNKILVKLASLELIKTTYSTHPNLSTLSILNGIDSNADFLFTAQLPPTREESGPMTSSCNPPRIYDG